MSTQQRSALPCDLDEIEDLLRTVDLFRARSLVVFKWGELLNRVVRLPVRTADSLTIEADPYVEPLEAVLEEHLPVLFVDVAKEEARFWSQHLGHLEEIESLAAFVPTDTVAAGRPVKVQRHRGRASCAATTTFCLRRGDAVRSAARTCSRRRT